MAVVLGVLVAACVGVHRCTKKRPKKVMRAWARGGGGTKERKNGGDVKQMLKNSVQSRLISPSTRV